MTDTSTQPSSKPTPRILLGLILFAAALISIPFVSSYLAGQEPPSRSAMLRHVITKHTDPQLRELHAKSLLESQRLQMEASARSDEVERKMFDSMAKCNSDVVFRTRNPEKCRLPVGFRKPDKAPWWAGEQAVFESMLLGTCEQAMTVREAKQWGCLPR